MTFEDLTFCEKQSLLQLYKINFIKENYKIEEFYLKQERGIRSLLPKEKNISLIPDSIKKQIEKKVTNDFLLSGNYPRRTKE